ncbi:MAG: ferrous iron transport protein B [Planctomycetota bacterium]|nr:ferrous iron transport protein B [Planctomycetota bacterium]
MHLSAEKSSLPVASISVALIGNPNTGKSTLFSALAGVRQRTGNYPGVTVEKKIGHTDLHGQSFTLIDLPGTYSLAPRSLDEMVTVDVLLGRRSDTAPPDVVLCIVDASNLERNLYLVSQVLSLGLPTVLALNMVDVARDRGLKIDRALLEQRLGVPVIEVQANAKRGLTELKTALIAAAHPDRRQRRSDYPSPLPAEFQAELSELAPFMVDRNGAPWPRFLAERLLLDTAGYLEEELAQSAGEELRAKLSAARERLASGGLPVPAVEAMSRYEWIARMLGGVVQRPTVAQVGWTDRIDRVLTHKLWGTLIFAGMMLLMFSAIFRFAPIFMDGIEAVVESVKVAVGNAMPDGALRSMLVDGVIAGVGGVVVFLPQILILFAFIAVLEDCGYMARAAYLMDKLMVRVGLSGKSFIPLLSSFACAIPGVMATRVIENRRDRFTTILVAPLMSCSARLPVYALLIGAFIPAESYLGGLVDLQGLTMFSMYLIGILTAVVVALLLKKTVLRGATPPFVMELPPYKIPAIRGVLFRMADRGWAFIQRAGTLIFAVSLIIWALLYFPRNPDAVEASLVVQQRTLESELSQLPATDPRAGELRADLAAFSQPEEREKLYQGAEQRQSYLGRMGHSIEPVVRPLGWDWRIGCAVIASFPAREVVLGTLGVIYNMGDADLGEEENSTQLQQQLTRATWDETGEPVYNIPVALSIMVFFALCAQCAATLAIIKRETNSWRWPIFTFVYMTTLAYVAALVTYQVGMLL